MIDTPHRFTVRLIVFDEADIHESLKQLGITAKTMDLEAGDSAIVQMKYPRAARITISPDTTSESHFAAKPLAPLMYNLTCMFHTREELIDLLKDTSKFVRNNIQQSGFFPGVSGDVPSLRHGAPFGAWILTQIEVEPPRHRLF
ncbi:hypothetical protein [Aurantimicrobium minutum]|uniref:hypothetical protein n=1 Tax=Aurantimicrobium minutum TaxID=708131 RepID=UPI0024753162|nr:hypothetical protein [Aurantimicrobium minutum]MDH6536917.1 hypothetical protein [Aurantimicrobium minutum]